jgi:hypothetical protein
MIRGDRSDIGRELEGADPKGRNAPKLPPLTIDENQRSKCGKVNHGKDVSSDVHFKQSAHSRKSSGAIKRVTNEW